MRILLNLVFFAWLICTVVIYGLPILVLGLLGIQADQLYVIARAWVIQILKACHLLLGISYQVHGLQNVQTTTPSILLSKHQSPYETLVYIAILPQALSIVLKKEIFKLPVFGWALKRIGMIGINRTMGLQAFRQILKLGKVHLTQGRWVLIFPEGTRIPRGHIGHYKESGVRLAQATHTSIVPVAITSGKCWAKNGYPNRPGIIDISFGPPIDPQNLPTKQVNEQVKIWIETEMQRLEPSAYLPESPPSTRG
ncbi:MAG: lysophospholipid acyltransferase family protein [Gammaproteobacteria bacterium]|nr:lysophospholipid acyltransferase family protein [Gammaproteobacteria bacterium]